MIQQLNIFDPVSEQLRPPSGNKKLVEYGVMKEVSDMRAHVAYLVQRVYVFPTDSARRFIEEAIRQGVTPRVVKTADIVTAEGYTAPISNISGLCEVVIPSEIYQRFKIDERDNTSRKGLLATEIVGALLREGRVPLPVKVDVTDNLAVQIEGTDILINASLRIQVKCDYKAGDKKYGGTGNLFLQVSECNPWRRH